jgi:lipopolysaccharide export system protein LptA
MKRQTLDSVRLIAVGTLAAALLLATLPALAQGPGGPPNALQGFSQNRDQPVQIDAAKLEVHDKDKNATFTGNVRMVQGDTTLRCPKLVVFYEQDDGTGASTNNTMTAAKPGPGGQQQIKRLEAWNGVVVTQKDQTATGEKGIFDMKSNTVTLLGNVVMTQQQNVLRGDRLVVDLTTGVSRVEAGNGKERVQGLFLPASGGPGGPIGPGASDKKPAASGAANPTSVSHDPPKPHPTGPSGLY